jgi:hypothetical protein
LENKNKIRLEKFECILLLSFFALFSFSLLYIFRVYDNNTLTSWQWTVATIGIKKILLFLAAALVFSFLVSRQFHFENYPVPVLTLSATMVVLPLWGEPELLLDSGRYFLQAKSLSEYGIFYFIREWGNAITAWTDMPLVPFLYGLVFKFGGESRVAVQFFNTIIFVLTITITYKIGATLWNRETGFYAGFLLLGMPYLLTQVPLMLVDIHTMFFLVLAVYCFLEGLRRGGWFRLSLAALTVIMAFMTKYSTWPMLALLPLCGFFYLKNTPAIYIQRTSAIILLAAVPVVLIFSSKYHVIIAQIETLLTYQRPALRLWHENFASTFIFQIHPFITLLSLYGGFKAYQARNRHFLIVFLYILLIFILQIQRIRYTLPFFPFLSLMAAFGLVTLKNKEVKRYGACIIVSSSLVVLYSSYLPFLKTTSMMNIKMAGEYLNNLEVDTVEVYTLPQHKSEGNTIIAVPQLDLFTRKEIVSRQDWSPDKTKYTASLSPLLSTWTLNKPPYYHADNQPVPLVIVSSRPVKNLAYSQIRGSSPPDNTKHFTLHSGIFRYKTFISIYY